MRPVIVDVIVYWVNLRVTVRRATRCPKPCDRLSSPLSVMLRQLRISGNETSNGCFYSLPSKFKSNGVESCKMPEAS